MLRELATTCPRNREDLQAAYAALPRVLSPFLAVLRAAADCVVTFGQCRYLHIVRSFAGGRDAAPAVGYGLANAGKTAAAVIKVM